MRDPLVLPILGVITGPGVSVEEVVRAANEKLFETAQMTRPVPFDFTDYYRKEMGPDLERVWCAGAQLARASALVDHKLTGAALESRWLEDGQRLVNVDPGYISTLQMVLATTKPLPQAVYLRAGVYAVVELIYRDGAFAALPWTYPDYEQAAKENLFEPFRSHFLKLRREMGE